jgi:hypothetical protein
MKRDPDIGDPVIHERHGRGIVVDAWGCFNECTVCLRECHSNRKCEKCGGRVSQVTAKGIYSVRFNGGRMFSLHKRCLELADPVAKVVSLSSEIARQRALHGKWWDEAKNAARKRRRVRMERKTLAKI